MNEEEALRQHSRFRIHQRKFTLGQMAHGTKMKKKEINTAANERQL